MCSPQEPQHTSLPHLVDAIALHDVGVKIEDILNRGTAARAVDAAFEHAVGRLVRVRLRSVVIGIRLQQCKPELQVT
jgi:hypothetical protein